VSAQLAGVDKLKPQFEGKFKGVQRTLTKMGPYTIKGSTGGGGKGDSTLGGQAFFGSVSKGLCNNPQGGSPQDCTMLAGRVGVQWADGRVADPSNGIYIHHILSSDTKKRVPNWISNCNTPNSAAMNVNGLTGGTGFLSTGEDSAGNAAMFTNPQGNLPAGYHIKSGDTFNYWAQLVNYNKEPAKVYVTFDTEWVPGLLGQDMKNIVLTATCGGGRIKMSEAGSTNTTSGKFYMMEEGRIMGARGHIHDGGVGMHMYINDKYTCSSLAEYGYRNEDAAGNKDTMAGMSHGGKDAMAGMGHGGKGKSAWVNDGPGGHGGAGILTVASMGHCSGPYKVKKGDYITLKAEYDLKKHPLRVASNGAKAADVMGMMGILYGSGSAPIKLTDGTVI